MRKINLCLAGTAICLLLTICCTLVTSRAVSTNCSEQEMPALYVCAVQEEQSQSIVPNGEQKADTWREVVPEVGRYAAFADTMTDHDVGAMALAIYHEARGECFDGQRAVAECIFNRVLDEEFADTVYDVIYERVNGRAQFDTSKLLTTEPIEELDALAVCFQVIDHVINETEYIIKPEYLYFKSSQPRTEDFVHIGTHYFSATWR